MAVAPAEVVACKQANRSSCCSSMAAVPAGRCRSLGSVRASRKRHEGLPQGHVHGRLAARLPARLPCHTPRGLGAIPMPMSHPCALRLAGCVP
jgi:hypothetical protein